MRPYVEDGVPYLRFLCMDILLSIYFIIEIILVFNLDSESKKICTHKGRERWPANAFLGMAPMPLPDPDRSPKFSTGHWLQ